MRSAHQGSICSREPHTGAQRTPGIHLLQGTPHRSSAHPRAPSAPGNPTQVFSTPQVSFHSQEPHTGVQCTPGLCPLPGTPHRYSAHPRAPSAPGNPTQVLSTPQGSICPREPHTAGQCTPGLHLLQGTPHRCTVLPGFHILGKAAVVLMLTLTPSAALSSTTETVSNFKAHLQG